MNRDVTLTAYFADMTGHELLSPEGEQALARDIEAREVATWARVLSFGPTRSRILSRVEEQLDQRPAELAPLRRAATIARRSPSQKNKRGLERAIGKLAAALRALDRDRAVLEAVLHELSLRPPKGRGASAYLKRVREAERHAARAREQFVNANLRLVVKLARGFARYGLPLSDLIQEGNLGLIKAVDRFDYQRGFRFSTYATWWIRHMIGRALANSLRTVRLPVHVIDGCQRMRRTERDLTTKLGRPPTNEELAAELDMTPAKVERTREQSRSFTLSLDQPVGDGGATRHELMCDPANQGQQVVNDLLAGERARVLAEQLRQLTPVQADVVRKRFGIGGESTKTLQEIADQYSLSRERIRQIETAALQKLRKRLGSAA